MKIRTLIVDDEYLIVKSLVHILSSMTDRFEVIGTGTDGEQAYSQICSLAPDLVLLDISMPRLDGLELLKRLHDNAIPMPTVIILSAYRNFSYAQQALHYGCREYLLKPFVKRELIEQLTRIADQIEQHRASAAEDQYALLPELLASRVGGQRLRGISHLARTQHVSRAARHRSPSGEMVVPAAGYSALFHASSVLHRYFLLFAGRSAGFLDATQLLLDACGHTGAGSA